MVKATKATERSLALTQQQLQDAEAQQRAWLRFEEFTVSRGGDLAPPDHLGAYELYVRIVIKNHGVTPAIDLVGNGFSIRREVELLNEQSHNTNVLRRSKGKLLPNPVEGGGRLMPQECFTNEFISQQFRPASLVYFEQWFSYRDIFGKSNVIGWRGNYNYTNDKITSESIQWDDIRHENH